MCLSVVGVLNVCGSMEMEFQKASRGAKSVAQISDYSCILYIKDLNKFDIKLVGYKHEMCL